MIVPLLTAILVGYLLGALPFGYLVARSKGINIFEHGSKNPGATNVKRVLGEKFGASGKRAGNFVFLLDALKGAVAAGWPFLVARLHVEGMDAGLAVGGLTVFAREFVFPMGVAGLLAALLGHCFSCFTSFRGGKGVATALGGVLVLMPLAIVAATIVWLIAFYSARYVSLASILAALVLPIAAFFLKQPPLLVGLGIAVASLVLIRHRANISRLMNGTESRFVKKTASSK